MVRVGMDEQKMCFAWDVQQASWESIGAVLDYLEQQGAGRSVQLQFFYAGWCMENFETANQAIGRIQQIMTYRNVQLMNSVFMAEQSLDALLGAGSLIDTGAKIWGQTSGRLQGRRVPALHHLLPFSLLFSNESGDLVYEAIGAKSLCAEMFGSDWSKAAKGDNYTNDPAKPEYSARVTSAYGAVLASRTPRYDHIRALIEQDGKEPRWYSYERLLLPFQRENGPAVLVTLAKQRQDLNMPFLAPSSSAAAE